MVFALRRLGRHVRGNAVAYLALFLALSTSAVAATQITGKQIANNSVTSADIRNKTIRGRDVARNTLTGRDIAERKLGRVPDSSRLGGLAVGDFARQRSAFKSGEVTFGGTAFVAEGGPSVTVDVPASGLVAVFASAELRPVVSGPSNNFAAVGLFVDGNLATGLPDCGGGGGGLMRTQFSNSNTYDTFFTGPVGGDATCAGTTTQFGQPVIVKVSPGQHTFELRYVAGNVVPTVQTSARNRLLVVTPLG